MVASKIASSVTAARAWRGLFRGDRCGGGLVSSLDLVELNPFLDERGRTAKLMVELVGSLMGRKVFDRPTRSFG